MEFKLGAKDIARLMRECPEAACALLDYWSLKPKVMLPGCSWNKAEPNLIGFLMFLTMVSSAETQEWSQSIAHSSGLGAFFVRWKHTRGVHLLILAALTK